MSEPLVSVVVVSWNGRDLVHQCLASLDRYLDYPHEVLVVDNASHDGTPEMVAADFPSVRLIRNQTNCGFAAACNQGWQASRGSFVVFLNPDTQLTEEPFQPLVNYLQQHPAAATIGPEIVNPDGSHQMSVRNFPSWMDQAITLLKLRKILAWTPPMKRYLADLGASARAPIAVDQIMGACMVMPRKMLEELGGFDEGYWIWFEEVDWCQRAHQAGYQVIYAPSSKIIHHGGTSFAQVLSLKKHWWFLRSLWRYTRQFWPPVQRWSLAALMPISYTLTIIQTAIKPR